MAVGAGWLVCALVSVVSVVIGHLLGGPDATTRAVLAAYGTMRFPALALLVASIVPNGRRAIPVVLAYVLTSAVVSAVYGVVMKALAGRSPSAHPAPAMA
jgi:BASS family bile acid:Na+ symporter